MSSLNSTQKIGNAKIAPNVWGPAVWGMIHIFALNYKPSKIIAYKQFIDSLPFILPCPKCRQHLIENLKTFPLNDAALMNNESLFVWSFTIHNLVNTQLKKTSPSYNECVAKYSSQDPRFWGPLIWTSIHSFAAVYDGTYNAKLAFSNFIISLITLLFQNEANNLMLECYKQMPLTDLNFKSAHTLFLWSFLFHDLVNKKLGKASPNYAEIQKQYFKVTDNKFLGLF